MEIPFFSKLASTTKVVPVTSSPLTLPVSKLKWTTKSPIQTTVASAKKFVVAAHQENNDQIKKQVLFIMGATATGKTKLSVDLATHFHGEVINSDKIQVYKGFDIVTNKAPEYDRQGIPHHLIGFLDDPNADFTAQDFCHHAHNAINQIIGKGHIPVVAGGSNTYIKALVEDISFDFKANFDSCFLWLDVALPILHKRVAKRVDEMVDAGLVDEVRKMFIPGLVYTRGVWRSIGLPEMEPFFQAEMNMADNVTKKKLLDIAINEMKENTCKLVNNQLAKINVLRNELGWKIHRIDATGVYETRGDDAKKTWEKVVLKPSLEIVDEFLKKNHEQVGEVENEFSSSIDDVDQSLAVSYRMVNI